MIEPDKNNAEERIILPVIVAAPEPFFSHSTIYRNIGTIGKENTNLFTILVGNKNREHEILLN